MNFKFEELLAFKGFNEHSDEHVKHEQGHQEDKQIVHYCYLPSIVELRPQVLFGRVRINRPIYRLEPIFKQLDFKESEHRRNKWKH
jgi:hypothetical protein